METLKLHITRLPYQLLGIKILQPVSLLVFVYALVHTNTAQWKPTLRTNTMAASKQSASIAANYHTTAREKIRLTQV
jgi:hypothetical protein